MQTNRTIIIHGPQGCGKTRNAKKLMAFFGLNQLIDGAGLGVMIPEYDTLMLTNEVEVLKKQFGTDHPQVLSFDEAMEKMTAAESADLKKD